MNAGCHAHVLMGMLSNHAHEDMGMARSAHWPMRRVARPESSKSVLD